MENRKLRKTIIAFNTLWVVILIIFAPLSVYLFSMPNYMSLYKHNQVTESIAEDDLVRITGNLIGFFKNSQDIEKIKPAGSAPAFTDAEINHLEDVRAVTNKLLILFYSSLILFVLFTILLIHKKIGLFLKSMGMVFVSAASAVVLILLLLYTLSSNFWVFFEQFHQVFFPQGNYMFPADSLLITLFPIGFFYQFFLKLVATSGVILVVMLVVGILFLNIDKLKNARRQDGKNK